MKKLLTVLLTFIFIFSICSFTTVLADELPSESAESTTDEETPEEDTKEPSEGETSGDGDILPTPDEDGKIVITPEELKDIINAALTESQQEVANNLANKIAAKFGINPDTVYFIIAIIILLSALVIGFLIRFLVVHGKVKAINTKLTATQAAYSNEKDEKDRLFNTLNSFSDEKIGKIVGEALPDFIEKVGDEIVSRLHIEDNTIAEMLSNDKLLLEQVTILSKALSAIAAGNRDTALQVLAESPAEESVKKLALENEKLRAELGAQAIKKVVGEEIPEKVINETQTANNKA